MIIFIKEPIFLPYVWSQKPPEAVSEVVNFKIFVGEHAPSLSMLLHTIIPLSNEKSCIKSCTKTCTIDPSLQRLYCVPVSSSTLLSVQAALHGFLHVCVHFYLIVYTGFVVKQAFASCCTPSFCALCTRASCLISY